MCLFRRNCNWEEIATNCTSGSGSNYVTAVTIDLYQNQFLRKNPARLQKNYTHTPKTTRSDPSEQASKGSDEISVLRKKEQKHFIRQHFRLATVKVNRSIRVRGEPCRQTVMIVGRSRISGPTRRRQGRQGGAPYLWAAGGAGVSGWPVGIRSYVFYTYYTGCLVE